MQILVLSRITGEKISPALQSPIYPLHVHMCCLQSIQYVRKLNYSEYHMATEGLNVAVKWEAIMTNSALFVCLSLLNGSYYFLHHPQQTIHPLKLHPSLLFADSSSLGFKIVCSNLAVTAVRFVEDLETNTCCHLSACLPVCLSVCLPGLWGSSQVTGFHSAICLICWFESRCCFVCVCERPNVQALQVCVCMRVQYEAACQYSMFMWNVCVFMCPADWAAVKHFQMQGSSWQQK